MKSVEASPDLRNKEELIHDFIDKHTPGNDVHDQWQDFVRESQKKEIEKIISEEKLKRDKALEYVSQAFRDGGVRDGGTALANILPPMGLFGNAGAKRAEKKNTVLQRIKNFFDRFFDISGGNFFNPDETDKD